MRDSLARWVIGALVCVAVVSGCGGDGDGDEESEQTAQEAVCERRSDLADAFESVQGDLADGNLGLAQDGLGDIQTAAQDLRLAVDDLSSEQREALQPDVEALSEGISALQEARSLGEVEAAVQVINEQADAIVSGVGDSVSCD